MSEKLGAEWEFVDDEYIANNLLKVNVFYREFSYKEILEEPGYTVVIQWVVQINIPVLFK